MDYFVTELGKTLRIDRSNDEMPSIELLTDGVWTAAPIRMMGLRLAPSSRPLSPAEIRALPA
jgi:hypothetical protein